MDKLIKRIQKSMISKKEIIDFCLKNQRKPTHGVNCKTEKERKMFWRMRGYTNPAHPTYDYNFTKQLHQLGLSNRITLKNKPRKALKQLHLYKNIRRDGEIWLDEAISKFNYLEDSVDLFISSLLNMREDYIRKNVDLIVSFVNKYGVLPANSLCKNTSWSKKRISQFSKIDFKRYKCAYDYLYRLEDPELWKPIHDALIHSYNTKNKRFTESLGSFTFLNNHLRRLGADYVIDFYNS